MAKLFGESISKDVVKQLEQRESILATGARDSQHLRYLNEKTAWVRAISGIDLLSSAGSTYDPKLAKQFILSGGKLIWNSTSNPPRFEPRSNRVNFGNQEDGRYSYNETLGIRPEPGITSFSISHKNRFGTIREANLSFTVWTREDLNRAQALYLRPGAQVIVEWGNSIYVTNEGEGTVESIPISEQYRTFFSQTSVEQIYEIIKTTKKETDYNYDGFLGLVSNFNWSFRNDGGYDCSISVVSRSSVLESISLHNPVDRNLAPPSSVNPEVSLFSYLKPDQKKSFLSYFIHWVNKNRINDIAPKGVKKGIVGKNHLTLEDLKEFQMLAPNPKSSSGNSLQTFQTGIRDYLIDVNKNYIYPEAIQENFLLSTLKVYGADFTYGGIQGAKIVGQMRYVSLRVLLALINKSFIYQKTRDVDLPGFYIGQPLKNVFLDDNNSVEKQTYKTFDKHFSVNPYFAILPKVPQSFTEEEKEALFFEKNDTTSPYFKYSVETTLINPFQIKINNISQSIIEDSDPEDLLDIHLNLSAINEILEDHLSTDGDAANINVLDFVRSILRELSSSLGGINSFDIHFDEELQKFIIVDREIVNEKLSQSATDQIAVQKINVTGLRNTVVDLNIQSKISSELSSMIAISNQANFPQDANSNQPLIDWNSGTRNRFINLDQKGPVDEKPPQDLFPEGPNQSVTEDGKTKITYNVVHIQNEDGTVSVVYKDIKKETIIFELQNNRNRLFKVLSDGYKELNNFKKGTFSYKKYKKDTFNSIKGECAIIFKKELVKENKDKNIADQGLIPLELSMTLDGIGGLKIGQVFKIGSPSSNSNILPEIYDYYGFIITGIENTIDTAGKWTTTVKAQTFRIS